MLTPWARMRPLVSLRLALGVASCVTQAAASEPTNDAPPVTLPAASERPPAQRAGDLLASGPRLIFSSSRDTWVRPGGLLQLDARGAFGRGVDKLPGPVGDPLQPRLLVRRARLELTGQLHSHTSFYLSGELAGSPRVEYAQVDVGLHRLLHLSLGQQLVPFTQANGTFEPAFPWMERPLPVRFALPRDKDLGAVLWGETAGAGFSYEIGAFGGDAGRPNADRAIDLVGRVTARPLPGRARGVQVGASAMLGQRQPDRVGDSIDALTTEGGFAFWSGQRAQSDRTLVVIPSGTQRSVAGEVRVPLSSFDLRLEVIHASKHTREAFDGQTLRQSERFGTLRGAAFYAQIGYWLLGDPTSLEPAGYPARLRFLGRPRDERALLVSLRFESLGATYSPGDRASAPGDDRPTRDVRARVIGAGLNYHAGPHAAVLLHYAYTMFPDSSVPQLDPANLAAAPGNLSGHSGAHQLHELGGRVQIFL